MQSEYYNLLFLASFAGSLLATWILMKRLEFWGLVDKPGARRIHTSTTPRGGGIGFVVIMVLGFTIFEYILTKNFQNSIKILPIFLLIATISFIDDLRAVSIGSRLLVHFIVAVTAIYLFLYPFPLFHHELPYYVDFILAVLGLVAFLNIYNFLDGIDGITAVQSIHLAVTIIALCMIKIDVILNANLIITIALITLAYSIAFIMFNWHPAKIFLGDVGSISIGFLLGLCLLMISASGERLFAACSIASLYYLADGGITILIRLTNKEKIWQPHLKHFFQKAVKRGMTHKQVVCRIAICNFFLMLLSINALYNPAISIILAILTVMITIINFLK